jgi:hypothetical protein
MRADAALMLKDAKRHKTFTQLFALHQLLFDALLATGANASAVAAWVALIP